MQKSISKLVSIILVMIILLFSAFIFEKYSFFIKGIIFVLMPFIVAFTLAFVVEPIIKILVQRMPRNIAFLITFSLIFVVIGLLLYFLIPMLSKQLSIVVNNMPYYFEQIKGYLNEFLDRLSINVNIDNDVIVMFFSKYQNFLITKVMTLLEYSFTILIQVVTTIMLFVYFTIYFEDIKRFIKKKFINSKYYITIKEINDSMHNYFNGFFTIIGLLTILASLAFCFLGFDSFLLFGFIIGITDIIPYLGPYIGGSIVCLLVLGIDSSKFTYSLIVIVCLQLIEECIIAPRIHSKRLEINPIIVILAVAIFGKLLGIIGMIIAVPVVRIMIILSKQIFFMKKL